MQAWTETGRFGVCGQRGSKVACVCTRYAHALASHNVSGTGSDMGFTEHSEPLRFHGAKVVEESLSSNACPRRARDRNANGRMANILAFPDAACGSRSSHAGSTTPRSAVGGHGNGRTAQRARLARETRPCFLPARKSLLLMRLRYLHEHRLDRSGSLFLSILRDRV